MAMLALTGIIVSVGTSQGSTFELNAQEKLVSIDLLDFGNPTLTTTTTTYNGTACGYSITVVTAIDTGDYSNGYRLNSTRYITFPFGTATLTGFSGTFYTSSTANRHFTFNGTSEGPSIKASNNGVLQQIVLSTQQTLVTPLTGTVTIGASASLGVIEMTLYYTVV